MIVTLSRDELSWTRSIIYWNNQEDYDDFDAPHPTLDGDYYTFDLSPRSWHIAVAALIEEKADDSSRGHCNYPLVVSALDKFNEGILAVTIEEALGEPEGSP